MEKHEYKHEEQEVQNKAENGKSRGGLGAVMGQWDLSNLNLLSFLLFRANPEH